MVEMGQISVRSLSRSRMVIFYSWLMAVQCIVVACYQVVPHPLMIDHDDAPHHRRPDGIQ